MADEYAIVLVERWTFLNEQRNPTDGYRVTFSIPDLGMTDHIIIAKANYNPTNVKKAIQAQVSVHKAMFAE